MKIIKVRGCHECPYQELKAICCYTAAKFRKIVTGDEVKLNYDNKTLPDNCPLESDNLQQCSCGRIVVC
jgi:hypothetical protein